MIIVFISKCIKTTTTQVKAENNLKVNWVIKRQEMIKKTFNPKQQFL